MKKVLVFQHVPYEILGTFHPLLKESGFRIRYINFGRFPETRVSIESYEGLIILGGPMHVRDYQQYPHLSHEIELIQKAIHLQIPVLGICLGAQLIAAALGANVKRNPKKEIGWYRVGLTQEGRRDFLFQNFQEEEMIFQWHGDTFDIPENAQHLAYSQDCSHQAFRYQDRVYGFQFHLEVDEAMIHRWMNIPDHQEELRELAYVDPEKIQQDTLRFIQRQKELSRLTFNRFVDLFGMGKKFHRLGSRY